MRIIIRSLAAGAVVLSAAACSGSQDASTELSADLRKDLELAKASGLELASSQRAAMQVVSAVESAPAGRQAEAETAPRRTPRRTAPPAPAPVAEPTPEPGDASIASEVAETEAMTGAEPITVAEAPAEAPETVPEPAADAEPEVVSGPQALPEDGPAPVRRPRGGLGGIGDVIGVVIRGGTIGVDDCAIHPRGGIYPRGGTIGRGYPGTVVSTPTYGGGRTRSPGIRTRGGSSGPSAMPGSGGRGRTRGGGM